MLLISFLSMILLDVGCGLGCNKKTCDDTTCADGIEKFPMNGMSFFYFKDDSYWIYKNEETNEIDSHWVTESKYGHLVDCEGSKLISEKCFEYGALKLNCKLKYIKNSEITIAKKALTIFSNDTLVGNNVAVYLNRISFSTDNFNIENSIGGQVKFLSSYEAKGILYSKVFHVFYVDKNIDLLDDIFYADGVGVFRYKTKNNQFWNLIRYNVKQ